MLWQGGFKNPYSGIIVWPEPDPVKTKLTLFKNSEKELYQYQDKPWKILVQNVSPSGKWKVIAVGSLDISEYITEEPTSHDITVTLKPVKKTVLSGSLEFTLSSVILEDGVPRRTDQEIFDEIMNDAIAEIERKKSPQKASKSNGQGSKSSSQKTSGHKAPVSDTAACDSQEAASCSHSNIVGQRKVDSKVLSHPPPLHAASQPGSPEPRPPQLPPSNQPDCEVKEVKSFLSQTEEKASDKKADKYPKELGTFGEKESDDRQSSLSLENTSDLFKETSVKDAEVSDRELMNKNLDQADGNNNFTNNDDVNIAKNDSRDDDRCPTVPLKKPIVQNEAFLKKAKRHVPVVRKELNRTKGDKSSKPKGRYYSGCRSTSGVIISVNGGSLRRGTIKSKTKHIQAKPVLKRAKPYVLVDLGDGHQSTPGEGPSRSDGLSSDKNRSLSAVEASSSDEETPVEQEQSSPKTADLDTLALSEAHSISLVEASPSKKETPFNQEESAPRPTDPEASNPSEAAGFPTVVHNAVLEGSIVARETESSNLYQNNQRQSENGLPISQHCPALSVYIREETSLLQDEIASLEKVSTKLEMEIQGANKTQGCEELEGLTQDWVSLNKCRAELSSRKRDLEILGREKNLEECINGIRQELMFLFELEDWRKTDQHKACEQKLIDAIVSLARKNEFNNFPTGLKL